jgi:hypothetical protein
MLNVGAVISVGGYLLALVILARGLSQGHFKLFPVFYSYMIYVVVGTGIMYGFLEFNSKAYPTAFWYYYLVTILVEFSVLIEISDHIFQPFPAIRLLGRALTILISSLFAILYVLPSIIHTLDRRNALIDFTTRSSTTKLAVIVVILLVCRHLRLNIGKTTGGLMLGFSLFHGINVANYAAARTFGETYGGVLWLVGPASYSLCLIIWLVALWNCVPASSKQAVPEGNPRDLELGLTRFNNELSKFLER